MSKKLRFEEITAMKAAERLHIDRSNVLRMIRSGKLTARLADSPRPYYMIAVDDTFLAEEKARSQSKD